MVKSVGDILKPYIDISHQEHSMTFPKPYTSIKASSMRSEASDPGEKCQQYLIADNEWMFSSELK